MPLSNNINVYDDVRQHFDRALEHPRGIALTCETRGRAINLRQRMCKLRSLVKEQNSEIYDVGDPQRSTTPWDLLKLTVEDNRLLIEPFPAPTVEVL